MFIIGEGYEKVYMWFNMWNDISNCSSCLNRKRIIEILEKNNIYTKENIE